MTDSKITDETPCFFIKVCRIDKSALKEYPYAEARQWHTLCTSTYLDGTKADADRWIADYVRALTARGDAVVDAVCLELSEFERHERRHPRRSVIADWGSCDLRCF